MASDKGRKREYFHQTRGLPVYLYNGITNIEQQDYGLYPAKRAPIYPSKIKKEGYRGDIHTANKQSENDVKKYNEAITEIKNDIGRNNRDEYLKQISHIIRGTFATENDGANFVPGKTEITMDDNGLSNKQRQSLKNYQNSWLRISMPEGQEFLANGNGRDAQIKKYLIKDGYIYEIDIKDQRGDGYIKANKYKATKENKDALRKGYDIYNLNRLLDRAKTDDKRKAILGEDISDLLPSEIKLTDKMD